MFYLNPTQVVTPHSKPECIDELNTYVKSFKELLKVSHVYFTLCVIDEFACTLFSLRVVSEIEEVRGERPPLCSKRAFAVHHGVIHDALLLAHLFAVLGG